MIYIEKLDKSIEGNKKLINLYCKIIPKLIHEKAKIFFRMSPDNKVKLINFFKKDTNSVVAMCGDGANDCGALITADIGISLNDNDHSKKITSHFTYKYNSISCIDMIIKNGRSCFESNIMILKYTLIGGSVNVTIYMCMYFYYQDFSDNQYLYYDFLASLLLCILASK